MVRRPLRFWYLLAALLILILVVGWCSQVIARAAAEQRACTAFELSREDNNPRNGYCLDGWFVPGLIANSTYYMPPPQHFTTRWLYYAEGLIEYVAAQKGYDGSEDYIALLSPVTAGWKAYLKHPDTGEWLPVRVVDVAAREHVWYHAKVLHSGGELSYALAQRLDVINWRNADGSRYRWLELCICDANPEALCAGAAVDFEQWFDSVLRWSG